MLSVATLRRSSSGEMFSVGPAIVFGHDCDGTFDLGSSENIRDRQLLDQIRMYESLEGYADESGLPGSTAAVSFPIGQSR